MLKDKSSSDYEDGCLTHRLYYIIPISIELVRRLLVGESRLKSLRLWLW